MMVRGLDLLAVGGAVDAAAMTVVERGEIETQDSGAAPLPCVQPDQVDGVVRAMAGAATGRSHPVPAMKAVARKVARPEVSSCSFMLSTVSPGRGTGQIPWSASASDQRSGNLPATCHGGLSSAP